MIRDVTDLDVYRQSLQLLKELYVFIRRVPKKDSVLQIKRAAKSVPANIAEGFAKRSSEKEFKRFLKIAIGSSDEVISHLRTIATIIPRLINEARHLATKYKILSKRLNKLHTTWNTGYF